MKFETKILIDFKDFFKSGKFDFIKIGQTKDWILNNFPDPDGFNENPDVIKSPIWFYGNLEFHFYENKLTMIFSDYITTLNGGNSLELNKWFLNKTSELNLISIIEKLNDERISYHKESNNIGESTVKLKLESGIMLGFALKEKNDEDHDDFLKRSKTTSENEFELQSFNQS